ncbi:MAG: DUF721 domain-containing protein [bacterium]|nr:DUF721 domain-containing protein [bacterium]
MKARTKRKGSGTMRAFSHLVSEIRRGERWGRRLSRHPVFLLWRESVGEGIARGARPVFVKSDTLWVEVGDSAWLQEMEMRSVLLLETLNARLGKKKLKALKFRVGQSRDEEENTLGVPSGRSVPPAWAKIAGGDRRAIDDALENIADAELKARVANLVERVERISGERNL